jgi:hypothetical protein
MSCADTVKVGDVGTIFRLTLIDCATGTAVDVSGQTAMVFNFKKPDGTIVQKTPTFTTDGTDGQIQYTTIAADIDASGKWFLQGNVTIPSGQFSTGIVNFRVKPVLA